MFCRELLDRVAWPQDQTAVRNADLRHLTQTMHCAPAAQANLVLQQQHTLEQSPQHVVPLPLVSPALSSSASDRSADQAHQALGLQCHAPVEAISDLSEAQHGVTEQARCQPVHVSQQTQTLTQHCCSISQAAQTEPWLGRAQQTQTEQCQLQSRQSQAVAQAHEACSQTEPPARLVSQHTQSTVPVQSAGSQTSSADCLQSSSQHTQASASTAEVHCQTGGQEALQHASTQTHHASSSADACCQTSRLVGSLCVSTDTQVEVSTADQCSQTLQKDEQQIQTQARLQEMQDELTGAQMKVQSLQSIVQLQEQQLHAAASVSASQQVGIKSCKWLVLTVSSPLVPLMHKKVL